MERESERKISYDHAIEAAACSQNSLAGESRGNHKQDGRQLPELMLAQK